MVTAFGLLAALFVLFPGVDLLASQLFFREGQWLVARDSPWLWLPYRGLPRLGQAVVAVLLFLFLFNLLPRTTRGGARRVGVGFLLAAALIGPIAVVDMGFKEHSGRARPINIREFGGDKQFTPAFILGNQCRKNCAFVSGHVATAAFVMAFGWLAGPRTRRRWLLASVAAAGLIGLARILPGGHFLSDVVFAWFAVYFSLWLTEWLWRRAGWLAPAHTPVAADPPATT